MATTKYTVDSLRAKLAGAPVDALGISSDPEALMHLANATWTQALVAGDLSALAEWCNLVRDVDTLGSDDPAILRWLDKARLRVALLRDDLGAQLRERVVGLAGARQLELWLAKLSPRVTHLDSEERRSVEMSLRIDLARFTAGGAAGTG